MAYKREIYLQARFDLKSGSCVGCSLGSLGVWNLETANTSAWPFWVAFNKTAGCGREAGQEQLHPSERGRNTARFSNTEFVNLQLQPGRCSSLTGKVSAWYDTTGSTWIQAGKHSSFPLLMEMLEWQDSSWFCPGKAGWSNHHPPEIPSWELLKPGYPSSNVFKRGGANKHSLSVFILFFPSWKLVKIQHGMQESPSERRILTRGRGWSSRSSAEHEHSLPEPSQQGY